MFSRALSAPAVVLAFSHDELLSVGEKNTKQTHNKAGINVQLLLHAKAGYQQRGPMSHGALVNLLSALPDVQIGSLCGYLCKGCQWFGGYMVLTKARKIK